MDYSHTPATSAITPKVSKIAVLVLRVLTTVFLVLSLAILISNVVVGKDNNKAYFYDIIPYRYMAVAIIIGIVYSGYQTAAAVVSLKRDSQGNILLQFYGDKVLSNLVGSGAVAGFVMTGELQKLASGYVISDQDQRNFNKWHAADGFAFLGFLCAFALSVLSSYALPKKV